MTRNGSAGRPPCGRHHRPRHAEPWARAGHGRQRRLGVIATVSTVAVATIAAGLGPIAEAASPAAAAAAGEAHVAPANLVIGVAPRTAPGAAGSPGSADAAKRIRVTKRTSRASFRPSASPYRFASKRFNRWYARRYMAYKYKWNRNQFRCIAPLWGKESAWNERAHNSGSGAHGIPQATPGSKMAKYGRNWRSNPTVQIKWGLAYIHGVYRTPCRAWSFWRSHHWY